MNKIYEYLKIDLNDRRTQKREPIFYKENEIKFKYKTIFMYKNCTIIQK